MSHRLRYLVAVLTAVAVAALLPGPAAASPTVSLVAWGLDSPRGVAFIDSKAFVAEAGHGSNNAENCFLTPFGNTCVGNTSQVSWVNTHTGEHAAVVTGLFSITLGREGALGASGLAVRGGKLYVQIGATAREMPPTIEIGKQAGSLLSLNPKTSKWTTIANVGNFGFDYTTQFTPPNPTECGQCPGSQEHDANPNDVLATSHGLIVADSGSNTITKVGDRGQMEILYHFPWRDPNPMNFPNDEVPTCVATGGNAIWVGTLAGHLYRFADTKATLVTPTDSGGNALLSHVTGCTSRGGNLYLVNMFGAGQFSDQTFFDGNVVKYNTESGKGEMLADAFHNPALFLPYSAKFGPDGNLYVTTGAVCNADGTSSFGNGQVPCAVGEKKGGRLVKISLR